MLGFAPTAATPTAAEIVLAATPSTVPTHGRRATAAEPVRSITASA